MDSWSWFLLLMGFPIGSVANLSLYGRSVNCQSQFQRERERLLRRYYNQPAREGEPIGASMRTIAHHPSIFTPRCGALQEKDWNPNSAGDPRRAANGNKELLLLELLRHFKWPIAELLWKENLVKIPGMLPLVYYLIVLYYIYILRSRNILLQNFSSFQFFFQSFFFM